MPILFYAFTLWLGSYLPSLAQTRQLADEEFGDGV
jgi:hypothetical protein